MRIIETISDAEKIKKGSVLSIGNFDGVHLGHQEILVSAKQTAIKMATELVVMTFEPHPLTVLHPQTPRGILASLALKKHLLSEFGVDCLFVLKSTVEFLNLSAQDFVEQFIVKKIQPSIVVEGESFNFGCGRGGSADTLQKLGGEKGFEVIVIGAKEVKLSSGQTVKISSTMIRNLLEVGRVADATVALGGAYRLIGQVVAGQGRGKRLGYPTTNMEPLQQVIPAEGVYAGFVQIGDDEQDVSAVKEKIPAALSIGMAETFGGDNPVAVEAHILTDDVGDLHDKWLAMDFVEHIRSQKKFETEAELAGQIAKDCEKAKRILKEF